MVIAHLIGGLGNQMFQYAAGRALSVKNHSTLALDISSYSSYGSHQGFELERIFGCHVKIASSSDVQKVLGWQSVPFVRRLVTRPYLTGLLRNRFVVEPHFHYWPWINDAPADCYLYGYWQSEKYFQDAKNSIRADFSFKLPLSGLNGQIAGQLAADKNAVSVHIRRGDYVSNPVANATHGLCSAEYYRDAIRYMAEQLENPSFYFFSDDMLWVKKHLTVDFPCRYIEHNTGPESYNDMRLMSLCRHHIIANSSFSWWGAWLNPQPQKRVIAPDRWFRHDRDTTDLYPAGWIRL